MSQKRVFEITDDNRSMYEEIMKAVRDEAFKQGILAAQQGILDGLLMQGRKAEQNQQPAIISIPVLVGDLTRLIAESQATYDKSLAGLRMQYITVAARLGVPVIKNEVI